MKEISHETENTIYFPLEKIQLQANEAGVLGVRIAVTLLGGCVVEGCWIDLGASILGIPLGRFIDFSFLRKTCLNCLRW